MQISFPMSKYSKKRREGVELRDLGHINLLPKVWCDPVLSSSILDDEVSVIPKCMAYLCGVFVFKGKVRNIELATSFLGTA